MVDVTEEENLKQLFEKLPIGIYKLDEKNNIARVNRAFSNILGYNNPGELEGLNVENLYFDHEEAKKFNQKIIEYEVVVNEKVELLKKNKERCYVNVCAFKKTDTDGKTYLGREGTIQDVTEEEYYRQIRDTIPVGVYLIEKNENGNEVVLQCNKAFADMFGYDFNEIRGMRVKELYATEKDYNDFLKEIVEKHQHREITEGIPINAKKKNGENITLEVHCRLLTDLSVNITGRTGLILNISNKAALGQLRDNIGSTLHAYSAAMVTIEQSIKPVLKALGPDPFETETKLPVEKALERLGEPATNLKNALARLLTLSKSSPDRVSALNNSDWEKLEFWTRLLDRYQANIPYPEFVVATLHELSTKILDISYKIGKGKLPREILRDLHNKAKELERICCLIKTHQALDTILEADYPVRALREYVIFQDRQPDKRAVCTVSSLLEICVYNLYLFAQHRNVSIKQDYQKCKAVVKVDERSILRVLSNLLYNAIKYSWYRDVGEKPWITVKAFTVGDKVHMEFENYGVPITREEIRDGLIFSFGYRGKFSGDRKRMGTGIGLSDARETARKHEGDVIIESVPASGEDFDYSMPFLTTATLILPIYVENLGQEEK